MAMPEEWKEFIRELAREVEEARGEVLEERRVVDEARFDERRAKDQKRHEADLLSMTSLFSDGPSCDPCPSCGGKMRARWKYCPRCDCPAEGSCLFCHATVPKVADLRFCPYCGNGIR